MSLLHLLVLMMVTAADSSFSMWHNKLEEAFSNYSKVTLIGSQILDDYCKLKKAFGPILLLDFVSMGAMIVGCIMYFASSALLACSMLGILGYFCVTFEQIYETLRQNIVTIK